MYEVIPHPVAEDQIDHLPIEALEPLAELFALLEISALSGRLLDESNPRANMRTHAFGQRGLATYFVLKEQREVHVLTVDWP